MTSDFSIKTRKKLIEVAIPLDEINVASSHEKSVRNGHPSNIHLYWARRPLSAARSVLFCQTVDDPSDIPERFPTKVEQDNERKRLFRIVSELAKWKNISNKSIIKEAKDEIKTSWERHCQDNKNHPEAGELFNPDKLPGFYDPFAGGGALPLEAQRLGLDTYTSDLNPISVLINKAMIEIPHNFAGNPPINPSTQINPHKLHTRWDGATGLSEDIKYYSQWLLEEAKKRIGHFYPTIKITSEIVKDRPDLKHYEGKNLTVISWIWARTVKSVNPVYSHVDVPLASTFALSNRSGKEAYIATKIDGDKYSFHVKRGKPTNFETIKKGTKLSRGANFKCILSDVSISSKYIYKEAQEGRMGSCLMAIVLEGDRERVYISPTEEQSKLAKSVDISWKPEIEMPNNPRWFSPPLYGLKKFGDIFTKRQLKSLNTFCDLIDDVKDLINNDIKIYKMNNNFKSNSRKDLLDISYADSICVYLGLLIDKMAFLGSSCSIWEPVAQCPRGIYGRQAIAMTWDYAEPNVFSNSSGCWKGFEKSLLNGISTIFQSANSNVTGHVFQRDAMEQTISRDKIISTDPPYYDNIGYADLSDFFYPWLRRTQKKIFPDIFSTFATPKTTELVATPYRHGGRSNAEDFFLQGMTKVMSILSQSHSKSFPITIYYAFKQSEKKGDSGDAVTGWETFLKAVIDSGLSIVGTWPLRTEMVAGLKHVTNSLASSIVLVCRERPQNSFNITRVEYRRKIREKIGITIRNLEQSNIAPVDMAQSAIGPGMEVFSSVKSVLKPDDSQMSIREALLEINMALTEYLSTQEDNFDSDTRFAITFFESFGYQERNFGDAEVLAKAMNVSVNGIVKAGIITAKAGKVQLLSRQRLAEDWDPFRDNRLCVWEATQYLIKRLESEGETSAAILLLKLKQVVELNDLTSNCRALAYRLFRHCENTKLAEEAHSYNGLIISWPELERLAAAETQNTSIQTTLL